MPSFPSAAFDKPDELEQLLFELQNKARPETEMNLQKLLEIYQKILFRSKRACSSGRTNSSTPTVVFNKFLFKVGLANRKGQETGNLSPAHALRFNLASYALFLMKKTFNVNKETRLPKGSQAFYVLFQQQFLTPIIQGRIPALLPNPKTTLDSSIQELLLAINQKIEETTQNYDDYLSRQWQGIQAVVTAYEKNLDKNPFEAINKIRHLPHQEFLALFELLYRIDPIYMKLLSQKMNAIIQNNPGQTHFDLATRQAFYQALCEIFNDLHNELAENLRVTDKTNAAILWKHYFSDKKKCSFNTAGNYNREEMQADFFAHYLAMVYGSSTYSKLAPLFFKLLQSYYKKRKELLAKDITENEKIAIFHTCQALKKRIKKLWGKLKTGHYDHLDPLYESDEKIDSRKKGNIAYHAEKNLLDFLDLNHSHFKEAWRELANLFPIHNIHSEKLDADLKVIRSEQQQKKATYRALLNQLKKQTNECAYPLGTPSRINDTDETESPEKNEGVLTTVRRGAHQELFPLKIEEDEIDPDSPSHLSPVIPKDRRKRRKLKFIIGIIALIAAIIASLGEGGVAAKGILCFTSFVIPAPVLITLAILVGIGGFICNCFLLHPDTFSILKFYLLKKSYRYRDKTGKIIEGKARQIRLDKENKLIPMPLFIAASIFALCSLSVGVCYGVLAFNSVHSILAPLFGATLVGGIFSATLSALPAIFTGFVISMLLYTVIHHFISTKHYLDLAHYFKKTFLDFPMSELDGYDKARVWLHRIASVGRLLFAIAVTASFVLFTYILLHGQLLKFGLAPQIAMGCGILNAITWVPLTLERITKLATTYFNYTKIFIIIPLTLASLALLGLPLFLSKKLTNSYFGWAKYITQLTNKLCLPATFCDREKITNEIEKNHPPSTSSPRSQKKTSPGRSFINFLKAILYSSTGLNTLGQGLLVHDAIALSKHTFGLPHTPASIVGPITTAAQSFALNYTACSNAANASEVPKKPDNQPKQRRLQLIERENKQFDTLENTIHGKGKSSSSITKPNERSTISPAKRTRLNSMSATNTTNSTKTLRSPNSPTKPSPTHASQSAPPRSSTISSTTTSSLEGDAEKKPKSNASGRKFFTPYKTRVQKYNLRIRSDHAPKTTMTCQ